MTGPTILTTAATPVRSCCLCGSPAVAGTGVAVARWWCLQHVHVGLANTSADLAILRVQLHEDDEPYTAEDAADVAAALLEESLPWRSDDQESATA